MCCLCCVLFLVVVDLVVLCFVVVFCLCVLNLLQRCVVSLCSRSVSRLLVFLECGGYCFSIEALDAFVSVLAAFTIFYVFSQSKS